MCSFSIVSSTSLAAYEIWTGPVARLVVKQVSILSTHFGNHIEIIAVFCNVERAIARI